MTKVATVTFPIDGYRIYAGQTRGDTDPAVIRFPGNFRDALPGDTGDVIVGGGGGGGAGTDQTARDAAAAAAAQASTNATALAANSAADAAEAARAKAAEGGKLDALADVTVTDGTATLTAGVTSAVTTAGALLTAPAPTGVFDATKPQRFSVSNQSGGTITLALPNVSGSTVTVTLLAGEGRAYRQSGTSGYRLETGIPLAQQDARYASYDGTNLRQAGAVIPIAGTIATISSDASPIQLRPLSQAVVAPSTVNVAELMRKQALLMARYQLATYLPATYGTGSGLFVI